jgi:hypothetical protein
MTDPVGKVPPPEVGLKGRFAADGTIDGLLTIGGLNGLFIVATEVTERVSTTASFPEAAITCGWDFQSEPRDFPSLLNGCPIVANEGLL